MTFTSKVTKEKFMNRTKPSNPEMSVHMKRKKILQLIIGIF